ncbi:MAG: DUF262 and DUF1524 domain-containing protein [Chloroflexota bacterium]|nr:DUF262 and DUF1524 domain-containing protein [Chloroflexota bacterium]
MKAKEAPLIKLLQSPAQFVIPIYQRTYSWTTAQCTRLWDDIVAAGASESGVGHFIGSIVYMNDPGPVTTIDNLLVIDGQQRLTTLTLLLIAMRDHIVATGNEGSVKLRTITDYYLTNPVEEGTDRYKLLLTQGDRDTLTSLVDNAPVPPNASRRIVENREFFANQLKPSSVDLGQLHNGILKLMVVDVSLDPHADIPQLIFESLNSTGLALTQADLIRNFILMQQPPAEQEILYTNYWLKMEQSFGQAHYASHFDSFMRHYLTIKLGRIPRIGDVYTEFKTFAHRSKLSIADLVADIYRYSTYYAQIALHRSTDPNIQTWVNEINELRVDTAYPLLLELIDDYAHGRATRDTVLGILALIDSYILRRAICGIPTNSHNQTFRGFSRSIDKTRYLESATAAFQLLDGFRRFPNDEEFRRAFVDRDIYNLTARRNYILRRLENHDRDKEQVNVESFTIEHVMPQNENLSPAWQKALGLDWKRIQETYLHTIGNLTLTGYNSELSDHSFPEKLKMTGGFRDSPIRLNRDLALLETWNEGSIQTRAARLADVAVQVWPAPHLPEATLASYRSVAPERTTRVRTLADHPQLRNELLALFELLRTRIRNLDSSVAEEIRSMYIAYKTSTNFVDVIPRRNHLKLTLNLDMAELDDPKGVCWVHDSKAYHGNGGVAFDLSTQDQLDYTMFLIHQSFDKHAEEDNE